MKKVLVAGGPAQTTIATIRDAVVGASWGERRAIVYTSFTDNGLWQVVGRGRVTPTGCSCRIVHGAGSILSGRSSVSPRRAARCWSHLACSGSMISRDPGLDARGPGSQAVLCLADSARTPGAPTLSFMGSDSLQPEGLLRAARIDIRSYRLIGPELPLNLLANQSLNQARVCCFTRGDAGVLAFR